MYSGFQDSPSLQGSRQLFFSSPQESSECPLTNSAGISVSCHMILTWVHQRKKVLISLDSILKVLSGMEIRTTSSMLSLWNCITRCRLFCSSLCTLKVNKNRKKENPNMHARRTSSLSERASEKNLLTCSLSCSLSSQILQHKAALIKISGWKEVQHFSCPWQIERSKTKWRKREECYISNRIAMDRSKKNKNSYLILIKTLHICIWKISFYNHFI